MKLVFKPEQYNSDYGMITYICTIILWHFFTHYFI